MKPCTYFIVSFLAIDRAASLGMGPPRRITSPKVSVTPSIEIIEWAGPWSSFPCDVFLRDYWQQTPLLVRGAFPELRDNPICTPDELAGIACDEDASSRLILAAKSVEHGPFDPDRLRKLPATGDWSLLVNDMERFLPAAHKLAEAFSFLPTWRHDDVMCSYAPRGSGIGAHVDSYDVFLVQGSGNRT
jgi:50S ribosomal protein L16 3-hydroxylase